ncbi:MAG: hypothetical protein NXI08_04640 [bacterium]|nr:hypothetical protein [bacterium]
MHRLLFLSPIYVFYLLISSFLFSDLDDQSQHLEPAPLAPGIISTDMGEFNPTFDVERGEFYFMRRTPGLFDYTIMMSMKNDSGWSEPEVAPFSGIYRDDSPQLSSDGNTLYFDSSRPHPDVAPNSINIWKTVRTESGWSEPMLVKPASLNEADEPVPGRDEFGPVLDGEQNLVFYSFRSPYRGGKRFRLTAESDYEILEEIESIPDPSLRTFVSYLTFSSDGNTVLMDGRHPDRRDSGIFYSCKLEDNSWSDAKLLPKINTTSSESGPRLSSDGNWLFYVSNAPATLPLEPNGNIYAITTKDLPIPCK